jgi:hypothetical protein
MGEGILFVVTVLAAWGIVLGIAAGLTVWLRRRSARMVDRWAEENGYRVLTKDYRGSEQGLVLSRLCNLKALYHVTVRNSAGDVRSAYVHCGGWFLGLLSDHVDVEWDD